MCKNENQSFTLKNEHVSILLFLKKKYETTNFPWEIIILKNNLRYFYLFLKKKKKIYWL